MKILAIGDVTSAAAVEFLRQNLWNFRKKENIDFCVVNGENAGFITGIGPEAAETLFRAGADVISGGNHTLRNRSSYSALDEAENWLRPLNFGSDAPGEGYCILEANGCRILTVCAMGNVHIEPNLDSPFPFLDRLLAKTEGRYDIAILDFHAEATGEKLAVAYAYDGKFSAVFGTHTHVPTADEKVLPGGCGYITDIGMCGESGGILGMEAASVIAGMRSHLPIRFSPAPGKCIAQGAIFDIDKKSGKCRSVSRICF